MSDRKRAIETLKQLRLDYEEFYEEHNNEVTQAYDMAISSLETDEAYQLEYESTTKNDVPDINVGKIGSTTKKNLAVDHTINDLDDFIEFGKKAFGVELKIKKSDNPDTYEKLFGTAKNDLGVDCVSRQAVLDLINADWKYENLEIEINNLPSVTPQLSSGLEKNSKKLEKDFGESDCISRQATVKRLCNLAEFMNEHKEKSGAPYIMAALFIQDNKTEFPPVTPQEPKTGYCKDCKFFELNSWAACGGIPIIVAHEICKAWGEGCKTKIDGYCFLFEPKESEG